MALASGRGGSPISRSHERYIMALRFAMKRAGQCQSARKTGVPRAINLFVKVDGDDSLDG